MNNPEINKIIISALLFFGCTALFWFLVDRVYEQGEALVRQSIIFETEQSHQADRLRLKGEAQRTSEERSQLESFFFKKEGDSIDFLNYVEALAVETGVTLDTTGLSTVEEKVDGSNWVEASFSLSGTKEQVETFIQVLENMSYVLRIPSVLLEAKSSQFWSGEVVVQVNLFES